MLALSITCGLEPIHMTDNISVSLTLAGFRQF